MKPLSRDVIAALSRRQFLAGAAGAALAATLPAHWAFAKTAAHTFKHGTFEVVVVSDGHLELPVGILAPDAPIEEVKALLKEMGQGPDTFQPATNSVILKKGNDVILFDTGSGANFQPTAGKLAANLKAAGIEPGSITKVVFTHGHPDHLGGTLDGEATIYTGAEFFYPEAEWNFWMDKDLFTKMPEGMHGFIRLAQNTMTGTKEKTRTFKPGDDIVVGVKALDTAGHTPGHASYEIEGEDGLIIVGDAVPSVAVSFLHPDWRFGFDGIPDLAITNRKKLLERASAEKVKLIGFHWPYPGVGHSEKKDTAHRYLPAS